MHIKIIQKTCGEPFFFEMNSNIFKLIQNLFVFQDFMSGSTHVVKWYTPNSTFALPQQLQSVDG